MLQGWVVVLIALAYIGFLFLVASYGDRMHKLARGTTSRLLIYPLSLAIYCTSWTFFGSVGLASRAGFDFLTIYIGPVLMVGLAYPLIIRIVRLAKGQNITSIADFIAARYGKSQTVAATVALIAIVGTIPYIALQLKAVSSSLETILAHIAPASNIANPVLGDIALLAEHLRLALEPDHRGADDAGLVAQLGGDDRHRRLEEWQEAIGLLADSAAEDDQAGAEQDVDRPEVLVEVLGPRLPAQPAADPGVRR